MIKEKQLHNYEEMEELFNILCTENSRKLLFYEEEALYNNQFLHELLLRVDENTINVIIIPIRKFASGKETDEIIQLCLEQKFDFIYALGEEIVLDIAMNIELLSDLFDKEESTALYNKECSIFNSLVIELYRTNFEEDSILIH
ncbi:MAG: hypothetical protein ACK5LC_12435 [Coprobacillaceae bacterium]